jgi:hypothetical protein
MMDLHDRLGRLAGPATPATDDQATADLTRGRRALTRRRTVKGAATGVFAVAAAAAVIAYGAAGRPATHPAPPSAAAPTTAAQQPSTVTARLVAYQGQQPKGYTIDKVPAGWEIQGVDNYVLTIAPVTAKDKDPDSFVGKIAVMLQSKDDHHKPNGINLIIQIWDARGWSNDAIVAFGAGIHVLPNAQQGVG